MTGDAGAGLFAQIERTTLHARWAGKFHRVRPDPSLGYPLAAAAGAVAEAAVRVGWHLVSWCGAWENLLSANHHHIREARARFRIADRPRLRDRCRNCWGKPRARNSRWPA